MHILTPYTCIQYIVSLNEICQQLAKGFHIRHVQALSRATSPYHGHRILVQRAQLENKVSWQADGDFRPWKPELMVLLQDKHNVDVISSSVIESFTHWTGPMEFDIPEITFEARLQANDHPSSNGKRQGSILVATPHPYLFTPDINLSSLARFDGLARESFTLGGSCPVT